MGLNFLLFKLLSGQEYEPAPIKNEIIAKLDTILEILESLRKHSALDIQNKVDARSQIKKWTR